MKVLHVVAPAPVGGLERVVHALAIGHHQAGHDVRVAAILPENRFPHPFLILLRQAGVAISPLVVPPRRYLRERAWVAEVCRTARPDVVHTHGYRPDVVDAGAARRQHIATVTTVHGFTGGGLKNRLYERLQRAAFRRFDAVVAVSRTLAQELAADGVQRDRIHLVPNAWSEIAPPQEREAARRKLGVHDGRLHVGWVGRLTREKGADGLIDALWHMRSVPLTISVLGDGRERARLQAHASALGVGNRFVWHGNVPEAGRLFKAFDVFVLTSRTEGTPMVVFEAMAAGVPIVATRVGGVPDVLSSAEAFLVPPEDPVSVARAIRAVRSDPAAARTRTEAARARLAAEFDLAPWLDRYEALYEQVQGRRSSP